MADNDPTGRSGGGQACDGLDAIAGAGRGVALQQDYVSAIRRVLQSMVKIKTASGLGSGVVYDTAGHIVTNAHFAGAATAFQVFVAGSAHPLPAWLTASYLADQVVGIPALAATDQQLGGAAPGIGFAISAGIAGQIIKTGHVTNSRRAALGRGEPGRLEYQRRG